MSKKTKLTPWNIQDHLKTATDIANFLESALEENDSEFTIIAVKDAICALRNLALTDAIKDPVPSWLRQAYDNCCRVSLRRSIKQICGIKK